MVKPYHNERKLSQAIAYDYRYIYDACISGSCPDKHKIHAEKTWHSL